MSALFIVVKELPKGALVEKQILYHTGRGTTVDEDGEQVAITLKPSFNQGSLIYIFGVSRDDLSGTE